MFTFLSCEVENSKVTFIYQNDFLLWIQTCKLERILRHCIFQVNAFFNGIPGFAPENTIPSFFKCWPYFVFETILLIEFIVSRKQIFCQIIWQNLFINVGIFCVAYISHYCFGLKLTYFFYDLVILGLDRFTYVAFKFIFTLTHIFKN